MSNSLSGHQCSRKIYYIADLTDIGFCQGCEHSSSATPAGCFIHASSERASDTARWKERRARVLSPGSTGTLSRVTRRPRMRSLDARVARPPGRGRRGANRAGSAGGPYREPSPAEPHRPRGMATMPEHRLSRDVKTLPREGQCDGPTGLQRRQAGAARPIPGPERGAGAGRARPWEGSARKGPPPLVRPRPGLWHPRGDLDLNPHLGAQEPGHHHDRGGRAIVGQHPSADRQHGIRVGLVGDVVGGAYDPGEACSASARTPGSSASRPRPAPAAPRHCHGGVVVAGGSGT